MHSLKILIVLVVVSIANARVIKRQKKIRRLPAAAQISNCGCQYSILEMPCGKSVLEPTYGALGTCQSCQSIFLDDTANFGCGCKCVETYGVLHPEVSSYGRVPAIKLPKAMAGIDCGIPIPAINLPEILESIIDVPACPCQGCQTPYQIIENHCCKKTPFIEYFTDVPSPLLTVPYAEPYYMPICGCQSPLVEVCGCQNAIKLPNCGCQMTAMEICGCQNAIKLPSCGCQTPTVEVCGCQNAIKLPSCGCQKPIVEVCGCQNAINVPLGKQCGCQPVRGCGCTLAETPCSFQLSAVELPVYGYGCQSTPPPVTECGKYLRQVTLQPPFL